MNSSVSTAFPSSKNSDQSSNYRTSANSSSISDYTRTQFSNFLHSNLFASSTSNEDKSGLSAEQPTYDELKNQFILNSYGAAVLRQPLTHSSNLPNQDGFDSTVAQFNGKQRPASMEFLQAFTKQEKRVDSPSDNFRDARNYDTSSEHISHLSRGMSQFYGNEENTLNSSERERRDESSTESSYAGAGRDSTTDLVPADLTKNCRREDDYCAYPQQGAPSSSYLNDALSSYQLYESSSGQASSINHMVKAAAALGYHPSSLYGPTGFYGNSSTRNPFQGYASFESKREDARRDWSSDSSFFEGSGFQSSSFFDPHVTLKSGSSGYSNNEFSQSFGNYMLPGMSKFSVTSQQDNSSNSVTSANNQSLLSGDASGALLCDTSMNNTGEVDFNPRELEAFAEKFKQRRIKLGVTQADVGKALGNLKIAGVGSLSQSTICRFESLTLSHNNMVALKPILQAWLEDAEREANMRMKTVAEMYDSDEERKRKRTSITDSEKRSLEAFFGIQPRPSSEKIAQIAEKLNLKKNVVRVWFCNQRQKQKRMKFSTLGLLGYHSPGI
ncbi:POU domain, class 4, transcription factor 3 [Cichlidogyrus casuarinus]|uniref:POU domain protein n=1 Tax=Cichlidogyrus casuarinus TaxID=1844966 RepID=A0ABD2QJK2_9PLAT